MMLSQKIKTLKNCLKMVATHHQQKHKDKKTGSENAIFFENNLTRVESFDKDNSFLNNLNKQFSQ